MVSKCPKCGAEPNSGYPTTARMPKGGTVVISERWECDTMVVDGQRLQASDCRIRELTAENERLNAHLEGYADAFNDQYAEIDRQHVEIKLLRAELKGWRSAARAKANAHDECKER